VSAPAAQQVCAHEPQPDTAYTSTGLPDGLRYLGECTVDAWCGRCSRPIRRGTGPDAEWQLKYQEEG
jgi:hypothetical protein